MFGEGTAGDGNRVLPFRSALIGSARDALAEAEHTGASGSSRSSIAYTTGCTAFRSAATTAPRVNWYGEASLWPHLAGLVARGAVDVTVTWGEPLAFDEPSDRKDVARHEVEQAGAAPVAALRGRAS